MLLDKKAHLGRPTPKHTDLWCRATIVKDTSVSKEHDMGRIFVQGGREQNGLSRN